MISGCQYDKTLFAQDAMSAAFDPRATGSHLEQAVQEIINWVYGTFGEHVDWMQTLLLASLPLFITTLGLEWQWVRYRSGSRTAAIENGFTPQNILVNMSLGVSFSIVDFLMHLVFVGAIMAFAWDHRVFTIPINAWTLLPIFLLEELTFYVYHRTAHRVRWFWAQHVGHHSGETMNMSTAARQSVLNAVLGVWLFLVPPVFLGIHPGVFGAMLGINLAYQWFVHTEIVSKLHPALEWLFNTPSNHRVHHGRNPQYIDRNFGGVLMIYDHLFSSYEPENERVEYGIPRQIRSNNWFVLNLHEFVDMWRDAIAPGTLTERLKHFWKPPEWEREGHAPVHTWTVERIDTGAEAAPRLESLKSQQNLAFSHS